MSVRVRFAPSPTGHLHIGGARTALFNWLLARQQGGAFVLRIEDTDLERSSTEMVEGILDGMKWLGLDWDEGPYFQSQRVDHHRALAATLRDQGHAYPCFCSPELLAREKTAAGGEQGRDWQYDGRCRRLSASEVAGRLEKGEASALRFKVPEKLTISFTDLVYGRVEVESRNIEDFVLLRSDGTPTYHLSVVSDDLEMGISHVVRGVDHLSNTYKHVLLYQALEKEAPVHAHLPLILGPDKKRLSKRHGATSVLEYREQGFLGPALMNYLARLGWSPTDDREIMDQAELIECFQLNRVNKANALFDPQKLEWMNGQYLSHLSAGELAPQVEPFLRKEGLWQESWKGPDQQWFFNLLELLKTRTRRLTDFAEQGRPFLSDQFEYDAKGAKKFLKLEDPERAASLLAALEDLVAAYAELEPFDLETTETVLRDIREQRGLSAGKFIGAIRVGLTGRTAAPGIFDVIVMLGKERTLQRLRRLVDHLR